MFKVIARIQIGMCHAKYHRMMKQAEQANRARRGDIYSQGIAQMMSNF